MQALLEESRTWVDPAKLDEAINAALDAPANIYARVAAWQELKVDEDGVRFLLCIFF